MLVFLCVLILILAVFAITLRASIELEVNALEKSGHFCVVLFNKRIFCKDFWTKDNFVSIQTDDTEFLSVQDTKGKSKTSKKGKKKVAIKDILENPVIKRLQIPMLHVDFSIGLAGDAFATVLGFGTARILLYSVFGFIRTRYHSKVSENLTPCFDNSCLSLKMKADSAISMIDLLKGLFIMLLHKIKKKSRQNNFTAKKEFFALRF